MFIVHIYVAKKIHFYFKLAKVLFTDKSRELSINIMRVLCIYVTISPERYIVYVNV